MMDDIDRYTIIQRVPPHRVRKPHRHKCHKPGRLVRLFKRIGTGSRIRCTHCGRCYMLRRDNLAGFNYWETD